MSPVMVWDENTYTTPEERENADREKTGRWRCIGCGKFLRTDLDWNQCSNCDDREPEER